MSKGREIRCYDYVNHPYELVRDRLKEDALAVFQSATKAAASRARTVASELHVNLAGIEIATDITISVKNVEERPSQNRSPETLCLSLEWEATNSPHLFPFMKAELSAYRLTGTETQLDLSGVYEAPLGVLGGAIDALVGHRIADASVHHFIRDVAQHLRDTTASK
jgi:hypothetical protein